MGEQIEIAAAAITAAEDVCAKVNEMKGAALFIDYGTNHPNADTLQGIAKHAYKHVLEEPGNVDLTTLVDFRTIRKVIEKGNSSQYKP